MGSTRQGIWKRALADWTGGHWLLRGIGIAVLGLVIGLGVGRFLMVRKVIEHVPWLSGLVGAVGALFLWGLLSFAISLIRAPGKLLSERDTEIERLNKSIDRLSADFWFAFSDTAIETFYGEISRKTRQQRAHGLQLLYEQHRDAIRKGDYSQASAIIPIIKAYLPLLHQNIPHGSRAYERAAEEMRAIYSEVERYIAGLTNHRDG